MALSTPGLIATGLRPSRRPNLDDKRGEKDRGSERLAGGLQVPGFAAAAAWAVILLEAVFPLALLAPQAWLWLALAAMLAFHFATPFLMGLNKFPRAFAAAYPSVILRGRVARSDAGLD